MTAYLIYVLFSDKSFLGLFTTPILSNMWVVLAVLIPMLILLARHVIRIKLTLYKIFLQTFLSQSSSIYKFFSRGLLVWLIALVFSCGLVVNLFIFLCLIPVHLDQYIGMCIGFCVFWFLRQRYKNTKGINFLRDDLNSLIKIYAMPFILANITGLGIVTWEILHIDDFQNVKNISDALETSLAFIDPNNDFLLYPVRVIARHMYAWELFIQNSIPILGKPIYFIYLLLTEGAFTFFAVFLLAMPYKQEKKNGKN